MREKKVKVLIITDDKVIHEKYSQFGVLKAANDKNIQIRHDGDAALMHNKFLIIDYNFVLTGSYNWTDSASTKNQENVIVCRGDKAVAKYDK